MNVPQEFKTLYQAILAGQVEQGVEAARQLVADGHSVSSLFDRGIVPTLVDVGERFERLEMYLPEMMFAAEVVKAIHADLADAITQEATFHTPGKVVIGTAFGDIHDLGKNIVASMLEVNGFEVFDLGVNVEPQAFLRKAREVDADVIAVSSLLVTSVPYMGDVIDMVRASEDGARFKTLVGGGPVTETTADEIGADAYGDNAAEAVKKARALVAGS